MRKAFVQALLTRMERDQRIVLLLADVGAWAMREVFESFPYRAYNLGIREQAVIGMAAGLARSGLIPVVYGIAPFIVERAYEQIKLDLGYNELQAIIVTVGASYDYAAEGPTHQCPEDAAILSNIPGMAIYAPAFTGEIKGIFDAAVESCKTTYIRLSEVSSLGGAKPPYPGEMAVLLEGDTATVLAIGPAIFPAINAFGGESVRVIYSNRVKPLPDGFAAFSKDDRWIIVEPFYPALRHEIAARRVYPQQTFPLPNERRGIGVTAQQIYRAYKEITDG